MTFTVEQQWESAREIWRMHQIRAYIMRVTDRYQAEENADVTSPGAYNVARGHMMAIDTIRALIVLEAPNSPENVFPVTAFTRTFIQSQAKYDLLHRLFVALEPMLFAEDVPYPHHLQRLDHFTADPEQTWDKPPAEKEG